MMNDIEILILTISLISISVIGIPLISSILLPIFKPQISRKTNRYLYAFSSGFFLIMATVLFIGESKEGLNNYFETKINNSIGVKAVVAILLSSIIVLGLFLSVGIKYLFAKRKSETEIDTHNHDKMIFNIGDYNPKSKAFAIFFLLTHRIPDGLLIGILSAEIARSNTVSVVNIIFLCSFIVHMIPEELIIYYRQIDMGLSRKKATMNSIIAISLLIPLVIIGSIIGWFSIVNEMAIHIVQLLAASFLLFISIIEFIPEFLHDIKISGKSWYITIIIFILGIGVSLFVLSFHEHGHGDVTGEVHNIMSFFKFKYKNPNLIFI